jgi:hypothetical protein
VEPVPSPAGDNIAASACPPGGDGVTRRRPSGGRGRTAGGAELRRAWRPEAAGWSSTESVTVSLCETVRVREIKIEMDEPSATA